MTGTPANSQRDRIARRLAACEHSLADFTAQLSGVNDPSLSDLFAEASATAAKVLSTHLNLMSTRLADDIAAVRSEFARATVPREDPILGQTDRLERLRAARGALLAELEEVLLEAQQQGISARALAYLPETFNVKSDGLEPLLNGLSKRISRIEDQLKAVQSVGDGANDTSLQQKQLVKFYVGSMELQVSLARFETFTRGLIDLDALGRAIEQMVELTADFVASAEGMRRSVTDSLRSTARMIRPLVLRAGRGFRTLVVGVKKVLPLQSSRSEGAAWEYSLLSSLDRAIDDGEIWVAYQPKLDLNSKRVIGAEALIRWTHPEKGPMGVDKFIRVAEEFRRIERITRFVINDAVRVAVELERNGFEIAVSVNISSQLLRNPALSGMITEILAEHGLSPNRLILEIMETDRLDRSSRAFHQLQRLVESGLQLSIDDFGTGNATIDYLRYVPASEVKIDKIFISAMETSKEDFLLVQSIVEMAHSMDRVVVAEGVETAGTLQILNDIRCDFAQGFYISRPVPYDQLLQFLENQNGRGNS